MTDTNAFADHYAVKFSRLFDGLPDAYGLGRGQVVRETPTMHYFLSHLRGEDSGIGIFPLRRDGTVKFAAVDLDEPDFDLAFEIDSLLPGKTWVERSRSGNAHIWVFFNEPIEAWIPRGVMQSTLEALGRRDVEIFPKQDRLRPGMLGNYINLPYHGNDRPMVNRYCEWISPLAFVEGDKGDPDEWRRRARALGLTEPEERKGSSTFGEREQLHECAQYIYERRHTVPLAPGHRSVVLFNVAKQLLNWRALDPDRSREMLHEINDAAIRPLPGAEVDRIWRSVQNGGYTSTGCDDPLMAPYVHPECRIAHG